MVLECEAISNLFQYHFLYICLILYLIDFQMERIEFKVNDDTAKKWRYTNPEIKQCIEKEVDGLLKIILEKEEDTLWPFLKKLDWKLSRTVLMDSILEQILNEE